MSDSHKQSLLGGASLLLISMAVYSWIRLGSPMIAVVLFVVYLFVSAWYWLRLFSNRRLGQENGANTLAPPLPWGAAVGIFVGGVIAFFVYTGFMFLVDPGFAGLNYRDDLEGPVAYLVGLVLMAQLFLFVQLGVKR